MTYASQTNVRSAEVQGAATSMNFWVAQDLGHGGLNPLKWEKSCWTSHHLQGERAAMLSGSLWTLELPYAIVWSIFCVICKAGALLQNKVWLKLPGAISQGGQWSSKCLWQIASPWHSPKRESLGRRKEVQRKAPLFCLPTTSFPWKSCPYVLI